MVRMQPRSGLAQVIAGVVALAACLLTVEGATSAAQARTAAAPAATPATHATHAYVAKPGDGWFQIAHAQGVPMQKLLAANHATTSTPLNVGQKLVVPGAAKPKPKAQPQPQAQPKHG